MTGPSDRRVYENGVTIGALRHDSGHDPAALLSAMDARHAGNHDTLIVYVPAGMARDARERIWRALDTRPTQDPREFERDQMLAYDDNISRMARP